MVVRRRPQAQPPVPRHPQPGHRRAASRACCRWPSRPTTRARAASTSTSPTAPATSASSSTGARAPTAPIPAPRGSCCAWPTRRPTTTAGCCCSAPTGTSTSASATAAAAATSTAPRGNAQNLGSLLGKILRIDPQQAGGRPYTVPAGNPFARPRRRARRDLRLRPAQPVALLVRPPYRRPRDRRRRPGRGRGDRLRPARQGPRRELRLAAVRGPLALHAGRERARPRPARHHALPRRRLVLDHRRRRRPRPRARRAARPLPVRRHLQARGSTPRRLGAGRATVGPAHLAARPELSSFGEDARGRVYAVSLERPRLPAGAAMSIDALEGLDIVRVRAENPGPLHALGHQHLGRRPRPGLGRRPGPGDRTTTSTRSPPRSRRAAAPAGSRSRTTTATTSRGCWRCASGSAARGSARGATRPTCGSATVTASARWPCIPSRATRRTTWRSCAEGACFTGDAVLGEGSVFVGRGPGASTSRRSSACASSRSRSSARATARRCGIRRASSTSTSPTARSASASCSRRSTRAYAGRTSCSTPCGTTRRPRCGRRRRSRWGRTERSCAPRVAGLSQAARRQRHRRGQRGRPRPPRPRRRSSAACRRRRARAARRGRRSSPRARARPRC